MLSRSSSVIVILALVILMIGNREAILACPPNVVSRPPVSRFWPYPIGRNNPAPVPGRWIVRWKDGKLWGWDRALRVEHPVCFWYQGKCY